MENRGIRVTNKTSALKKTLMKTNQNNQSELQKKVIFKEGKEKKKRDTFIKRQTIEPNFARHQFNISEDKDISMDDNSSIKVRKVSNSKANDELIDKEREEIIRMTMPSKPLSTVEIKNIIDNCSNKDVKDNEQKTPLINGIKITLVIKNNKIGEIELPFSYGENASKSDIDNYNKKLKSFKIPAMNDNKIFQIVDRKEEEKSEEIGDEESVAYLDKIINKDNENEFEYMLIEHNKITKKAPLSARGKKENFRNTMNPRINKKVDFILEKNQRPPSPEIGKRNIKNNKKRSNKSIDKEIKFNRTNIDNSLDYFEDRINHTKKNIYKKLHKSVNFQSKFDFDEGKSKELALKLEELKNRKNTKKDKKNEKVKRNKDTVQDVKEKYKRKESTENKNPIDNKDNNKKNAINEAEKDQVTINEGILPYVALNLEKPVIHHHKHKFQFKSFDENEAEVKAKEEEKKKLKTFKDAAMKARNMRILLRKEKKK